MTRKRKQPKPQQILDHGKTRKVGDEGLELSTAKVEKCAAKLAGPISVVASVVAIQPVSAGLARELVTDLLKRVRPGQR